MMNNSLFETIDDFCQLFHVIPNCSCNNEDVRNMTKEYGMDDICEPRYYPSHMVELNYEPEYSRPIATIIVGSTLVAILGNSLVVAMAIKNWKSSIPYQKLIGQLGASDLLFASLHLFSVLHLFWTNKWIYGESLCRLMFGSVTLGSLFAIGLILIISIERYLAIVHPFFWKYGTKKLNYSLVAINVCLGTASVVPKFAYLHLTDESTCEEQWPTEKTELIYLMYIVIVYFFLPLMAMFYLNFRILYVLRHERMGSADCLRDSTKSTRKNTRTMRVLVAVIIAFTVLIMPNRVIMLYFVYKSYMDEVIPDETYTVITFIAIVPYSFHTAINPILYCIIDKSWRKQAMEMLWCIRFLKKKNDKRNSVMESHVNSQEATCVKTCSFLSEQHRPSHLNDRLIVQLEKEPGEGEKGPYLPLPLTVEVKAYSSSEPSVDDIGYFNSDDAESSAYESVTEAVPEITITKDNSGFVDTNDVSVETDNLLSLADDGSTVLPDKLSAHDDVPEIGIMCPILPDPDRETIL